MQTLWQDLRFAARMLRKSSGFAAVSVLTLAVAIGANAVVFSVMNGLMLRPLNVPQAENLYTVERAIDGDSSQSYPNYLDLRDRNRSFSALAVYSFQHLGLETGKNLSSGWAYGVSGNYFDALGIQPYLGRLFHSSDEHGRTALPISCSPIPAGIGALTTMPAWSAARCRSTSALLRSSE